MQDVSLDICRVRNIGGGMFEVEIPTWRPTNTITPTNDQLWHKMTVGFDIIDLGFIPATEIERNLAGIDAKNPYLPLRLQNPQIRDYRRENMGTFAPKKRIQRIPAEQIELIREGIRLRRTTDFNLDFTVYYKPI